VGILTDLIVAPLADAEAVAAANFAERRWPHVDVNGIGPEDLASMHCVLDGRAPLDPVTPPQWQANPFTKHQMPVTYLSQYLQAFEPAAEAHDGEIIVLRVPSVLVAKLAALDEAAAADLASKWSREKSSGTFGDGRPVPPFTMGAATSYLERILVMARAAVRDDHALLVWLSP
jgi:hypothetical protein